MNVSSLQVPCPPKKLELLRDCSSDVIVFSWEHTNNTDHYMARAVDSQVFRYSQFKNVCNYVDTMF